MSDSRAPNEPLISQTMKPAVSILIFIVLLLPQLLLAIDETRITKTGDFKGSGIVRDIERGVITIEKPDGSQQRFKIQDTDEAGISIGGLPLQVPAKIKVHGVFNAGLLEKGMYISFDSKISKTGEFEKPLQKMEVIPSRKNSLKLQIEPLELGDVYSACKVVGRITHVSQRAGKYRLLLETVDKKPAVRSHISVEVSKDAKFSIRNDNLNRVLPGDNVEYYKGISLSNGEHLIVTINVRMTAERKATTLSLHEQLVQKFSHLSDRPTQPRRVRNEHFIVHTDLSDRSAKILLAKLGLTYKRLFRYYGKQPKEPIECFVVHDQTQWADSNEIPKHAFAKIAEGAGVTTLTRVGKYPKSIVYSCDDHGIVQHEAVHAFCNMTFGTSGPIWYAEGMAEMGLYWRPEEQDVQIEPIVIDYLTRSKHKKLEEIIKPNQRTGDSWEAYAWRWALCHLLASNKNYDRKFKRLGIDMMNGEDVSFESRFGGVQKKIAFEYEQFIRNFDNGYRVDLCVWDWSVKPQAMTDESKIKVEVLAKSGWQSTPIKIKKGVTYEFVDSEKSKWKIGSSGEFLSADGDALGNGKLVAVIYKDYELSKPIELGKRGSFRAPETGQLFLRCRDKWTAIEDNEGSITVHFRKKPRK